MHSPVFGLSAFTIKGEMLEAEREDRNRYMVAVLFGGACLHLSSLFLIDRRLLEEYNLLGGMIAGLCYGLSAYLVPRWLNRREQARLGAKDA